MNIISPQYHNVRKGCYILVLTLKSDHTITVGRLGAISFPAGSYAYVGSALGGLGARLGRHLSGGKRLYWHIDYLLLVAQIEKIIWTQTSRQIECQLARYFSRRFVDIPRFGCSDCHCRSHLFRSTRQGDLVSVARQAFRGCGQEPCEEDCGPKKSLT